MLYRKEETPSGIKWTNEGVAQVRACQGHSIPWIVMDRLGVSIPAEKVKELPCPCHGTSFNALGSILKDSLKPASHLDPAILRLTGRSLPQRQATKGAGKGEGASDRNVLMMSPYAYFDSRNYIGGARKGSEVYIFLDTDKVATLQLIGVCT